jgi:ribosomal protein S27AE
MEIEDRNMKKIKTEMCPTCGGSSFSATKMAKCDACGGKGYQTWQLVEEPIKQEVQQHGTVQRSIFDE